MSDLLDAIIEALQKGEFKSGFIAVEFENGEGKTFTEIERLVVDLKGDNKGLVKRLYEEMGHIEDIESEFLKTLLKCYGVEE